MCKLFKENWFEIKFGLTLNFIGLRKKQNQITRLYQWPLQPYAAGKSDTQDYIFSVPIGSIKTRTQPTFYTHATSLKYQQSENNRCCFISLSTGLCVH